MVPKEVKVLSLKSQQSQESKRQLGIHLHLVEQELKAEEAAEFDWSNKTDKNGNGGNQNAHDEPTDHQLQQFVPDINVIGKSSELEGKKLKYLRKIIMNMLNFIDL